MTHVDYEICGLCGWEKPYAGACPNGQCGVTSEFFLAEFAGEECVWAKRDGGSHCILRPRDVGDSTLWGAIARMVRAGVVA